MDCGGIVMHYIKKIQPSSDVSYEISRVRREQKSLIDKQTPQSLREAFNHLDKSIIRDSLIAEQHGLCAYCMRRIENNSDMTIEHWRPVEQNLDGAMEYSNMLGVCDGGRKMNDYASDEDTHVLCCDASKGNREIVINPLNKTHMELIRYDSEGKIYTYPEDETLEKDINEVLHLNGEKGFDTNTRLIWNRREAYRSYERFIRGESSEEKPSPSIIRKKIRQIEEQKLYDEFAGVVLYFLKRRLRQLK